VADQKPAESVKVGVSPYLQQPLRSFEQAQQDGKRQQRQTADAATGVRTVTSYASSVRGEASLELSDVAAAELPGNS